MEKLGWGPAGEGKARLSGMQSQSWLELAQSRCFSQLPESAAHDFFSNGFFRSMLRDAFCDDVTEEVAKNTFLNAMNLGPDLSLPHLLQKRQQTRQGD